MTGGTTEDNIGSQGWFAKEAFRSLKKIEKGSWDYSSSSLLYTLQGSTSYEKIQKDQGEDSYKNIVTSVEKLFIQKIAPKIVKNLPDKFHYIDFGPGTEHKEEYFLEAIKAQGKQALYVPVDISKYMLDIANQYAEQKGFHTHPIHQTFENVTYELDGLAPDFRFISLGLTFVNYGPQRILSLLNQSVNHHGSSFITVHLRDRIDIEAVRKVYEKTVRDIIFSKIGLLGLNPGVDITEIEVTDAIEIFCTVKNTNEILDRVGIRAGDKMLLFRSYRYTLNDLKSLLRNYDTDYYDEGVEFIGCVING